MEIAELPMPFPGKGEVLVRTHFSAISTGTEGKTVSDARKGYLAKARSRQEEVAKVIKLARSQGIGDTYKMVMNRLEALQPLGYSASGVVMATGEGVRDFRPGDRVACGGSAAAHGEVMCVAENLCVKLPQNAPLDEAAFTTLGAIAMQGLRRAELALGERCAVIGLGLLGQITLRLLKASGVQSFGIDLKPELVDMAATSGAVDACLRNDETLEARVMQFSNGHGVDAVIITAATSSLDPVELAGALCRQRGKVVIVGNVPTGFSRKTYYRKELELRMSTSYGPGRYDTNYEEKGLDYPIGQVRWTENRNMLAFAELLGSQQLSLKDLISHRFDFAEAPKAFDLVVDAAHDKMGILLCYDTSRKLDFAASKAAQRNNKTIPKGPSISFIGAGSFAGNFLLPNLKGKIDFSAIATSRPHTAEDVRRKHGFSSAHTDVEAMLADDAATCVAIATRHNTHAPLAIKALLAKKRVFVEKPLCLKMEDYVTIKKLLAQKDAPDLMLGFNRRFAPLVVEAKKQLQGLPLAINYRINAGHMPAEHWVHDPEVGGGRIIGEVCHFVDLCCYLSGSEVVSLSANALDVQPQHYDTFSAQLRFANGSVAAISYFSNGNKLMGKEYLEIFGGGQVTVIDDFKSMQRYGRKKHQQKLSAQDKGHAAEMALLAEAVREGKPFPISSAEGLRATLTTFALLASIEQGGQLIELSPFETAWTSAPEN